MKRRGTPVPNNFVTGQKDLDALAQEDAASELEREMDRLEKSGTTARDTDTSNGSRTVEQLWPEFVSFVNSAIAGLTQESEGKEKEKEEGKGHGDGEGEGEGEDEGDETKKRKGSEESEGATSFFGIHKSAMRFASKLRELTGEEHTTEEQRQDEEDQLLEEALQQGMVARARSRSHKNSVVEVEVSLHGKGRNGEAEGERKRVRFRPDVEVVSLPPEEGRDAWLSRRGQWVRAPEHDELWDGDRREFWDHELSPEELKALIRYRRIQKYHRLTQKFNSLVSNILHPSSGGQGSSGSGSAGDGDGEAEGEGEGEDGPSVRAPADYSRKEEKLLSKSSSGAGDAAGTGGHSSSSSSSSSGTRSGAPERHPPGPKPLHKMTVDEIEEMRRKRHSIATYEALFKEKMTELFEFENPAIAARTAFDVATTNARGRLASSQFYPGTKTNGWGSSSSLTSESTHSQESQESQSGATAGNADQGGPGSNNNKRESWRRSLLRRNSRSDMKSGSGEEDRPPSSQASDDASDDVSSQSPSEDGSAGSPGNANRLSSSQWSAAMSAGRVLAVGRDSPKAKSSPRHPPGKASQALLGSGSSSTRPGGFGGTLHRRVLAAKKKAPPTAPAILQPWYVFMYFVIPLAVLAAVHFLPWFLWEAWPAWQRNRAIKLAVELPWFIEGVLPSSIVNHKLVRNSVLFGIYSIEMGGLIYVLLLLYNQVLFFMLVRPLLALIRDKSAEERERAEQRELEKRVEARKKLRGPKVFKVPDSPSTSSSAAATATATNTAAAAATASGATKVAGATAGRIATESPITSGTSHSWNSSSTLSASTSTEDGDEPKKRQRSWKKGSAAMRRGETSGS